MAVGGRTKEWIDTLSPHWNTYVALELGLDSSPTVEKQKVETEDMLTLYKKVKKVELKAKKLRGRGGIVVSGIRDLEKI